MYSLRQRAVTGYIGQEAASRAAVRVAAVASEDDADERRQGATLPVAAGAAHLG